MTSYIYDMVDTWNAGATTFTAVKMNVTDTASASGSLLMDLQVGGSSRLAIRKDGFVQLNGAGASLAASSAGVGTLGTGIFHAGADAGGFRIGASADVILSRRGTANLRLGAADAAAPVAQTLSVQSVVAGTTNTAGANLTITGSQGTGTGAGGSIVFQVAPAGSSGTAQNALATALTIASTKDATFEGSITGPSGIINVAVNASNHGMTWGNNAAIRGAVGFNIRSDLSVSWVPSLDVTDTPDTRLYRDAANTLALRNGANAQTFRVYKSYTSDVVNSYFYIAADNGSGATNIGTFANGSTANTIQYLGNAHTFMSSGGTQWWNINASGHFLAGTDNLYDIGATSSGRPRNVYVAGTAYISSSAAVNGILYLRTSETNTAQISAPSSGVMTLQNGAGGDFGRVNFGGTTSSFPALKRNSTALETKLADDSAYAPHAMQYLDVTDGITAPASATGRARIYVDTADGDLKVIFADGTVKTIVTDT